MKIYVSLKFKGSASSEPDLMTMGCECKHNYSNKQIILKIGVEICRSSEVTNKQKTEQITTFFLKSVNKTSSKCLVLLNFTQDLLTSDHYNANKDFY